MQHAQPEVSVIIPCYNGEHFIGEAIRSVLNQTFGLFEIIVVNDGSSDGSRRVIESYSSDRRLKYIEHDTNRGISAARNTGIKHSRGDLIAFLDQDDLWKPDKLEKQVVIFERDRSGEFGLAFSDVQIIEETDGRRRQWRRRAPAGISAAPPGEILRVLFLKNFITIISAVIRRRCFDEVGLFDESILSGADDYDLCLRLATRYKFAHIREPLALRREHGANYSDFERIFPDAVAIIERAVSRNPELSPLKKRRLSDLSYNLGRCYQQKGKTREARRASWDAVRYHPLNIRAFAAFLLCSLGRFGNIIFNGWSHFRKRLRGRRH